jgi:oligopeptide/dipeptide ABC transporter ATP-binding protein
MSPLLRANELRVDFLSPAHAPIHVLRGASLEIQPGEIVGLLGESGSGKSTLAKALLQLLPKNARICGGTLEFESQNLLALSERELRKIRGARIARIPQEPSLALSPVMKVGDQVAEVIHAHRALNWKDCRKEAFDLLERVRLSGFPGAISRMYDAYLHQLSGGQQQRVVIAQAIACRPALIVADEPTASLDTESESEILSLLYELKSERNLSLLFITHDPRILRGLADRTAVMYAGRIVEVGSTTQLLSAPQHPYTRALLGCVLPSLGESGFPASAPLPTIEGAAPEPELVIAGCSFAPRCAERINDCESRSPSSVETSDAGQVECFLYDN